MANGNTAAGSSSTKPLAVAGISLISIGIGLISYGMVQANIYVRIVMIVIGVVFNGLAAMAFIKVPASDTSAFADALRKIQSIEAKLGPFLAKYGGDIEAAIEAMVQSAFQKAKADFDNQLAQLKAQSQQDLDKIKSQYEAEITSLRDQVKKGQ